MLEDDDVQDLWKLKRKFDVVVVEQFNGDCSLGLAYKLNAPVVGLTSHVLMPHHYNRFDALADLPQRVVWKWETKSLPGKPKNIFVSKWLPQNDLLAHPKVLAFYSHCGLLGVTEAVYHGVPIVGMPIYGDQPVNAAAVEESGFGVKINMHDVTKENLLQKFKTVLNPE
ncbi:unnamed protein product, partial [Iphiclides podalirius]